ncbi:MAG: YwqG family protein [Beijerinckiaceae bacterium]
MSHDEGGLSGLVAALRTKTQEMAATDHVGHFNRLFTQRQQIYAAIEAHPAGAEALRQLFDDPDPRVQLDVAQHCKYRKIELDAALSTLQRLALRADKIGRDAKSSLEFQLPESSGTKSEFVPRVFRFLPRPPGCSKAAAEEMIRTAFLPEWAERIADLLRPAIRIWPKKSAGLPTGSRFGGLPVVPPDWDWPFADEEPFVFLAQINCAELGPQAKLFNLPDKGILSFFGDHDEINGVPSNGGAIYYFKHTDELRVSALPIEGDEPLITCDMDFYETFELPHPFSNAIETLAFNKKQRDTYCDLYEALAQFGFDESEHLNENDISKLLGWPDLVQREVEDPVSGRTQLLLQLGQFRDGTELAGWGPGGLLYFIIAPCELAAWSFDRAELTMQCT